MSSELSREVHSRQDRVNRGLQVLLNAVLYTYSEDQPSAIITHTAKGAGNSLVVQWLGLCASTARSAELRLKIFLKHSVPLQVGSGAETRAFSLLHEDVAGGDSKEKDSFEIIQEIIM